MPQALPASAYSANVLGQTHFAQPVGQNCSDLHSKHAVQCADDGDACSMSLIIIHSVEQRGLLHKVKLYVHFV
jgi:hypothetical protein